MNYAMEPSGIQNIEIRQNGISRPGIIVDPPLIHSRVFDPGVNLSNRGMAWVEVL